LVSKEGRITLLGGLDVDPSRTVALASIKLMKEGVRQWELGYEDPTKATLSRFIIANAERKRLFSVDSIGTTEVEGETLIVGPLGSNTSQVFLGRHRAWRLYKGIFDGGGLQETPEHDRSMLEITDPLNRARARFYQGDGIDFYSSFSVFGWTKMGSNLAVFGPHIRLGGDLSVLRWTNLGSSLSVRSFAKMGSSLSIYGLTRLGSSIAVLDFIHLGSALSLRSFSHLGSSLSVYGMSRLGSSLSVLDFVTVGSSLSLRGFSRLGSALAVYGMTRLGSSFALLDFIQVGSSLSLRGFARIGSSLAVYGMSRLGSSLSVLDFAHMGRPLSLRSSARLGSACRPTECRASGRR
jgi:acyl-[acyl carrier protein]--UDP-N-acetylglucosamine O-acyltransferase